MNNIPSHLYIAIGAVLASIIAGVFSYFNLVTSKETKVSEFRQEWINELRKEISLYVSSLQSLVNFESYIDTHLKEKLIELNIIQRRDELHSMALTAYNSIQLRINKNEKNIKALERHPHSILSLDIPV